MKWNNWANTLKFFVFFLMFLNLFLHERHTERGKDRQKETWAPMGPLLWDSILGSQDHALCQRHKQNLWTTQMSQMFLLFKETVMLVLRKREREYMGVGVTVKGQRERKKRILSRFHAQRGARPHNPDIMWPEPKSRVRALTDWATQVAWKTDFFNCDNNSLY